MVERWIVTPDKHVPYHDKAAIACVLQAIRLIRPHGYIDLGDFAEGESVSHWQWKKKSRPPLEYQLKEVKKEIGHLNKVMDIFDRELKKAGTKRKIYIQGNHDEWFDRLVEENPHLAETSHRYGVGYKFDQALNLKERGWEYYPIGKLCKIGKLYFYHGHHCKSSVHHAHWHVVNKGVNIVYGHFHDVQNRTITHADSKKGAWSLGCLKGFRHEDGNQWLGRRGHNWDHAFGIVTFYKGGRFDVNPIMIIDGKCVVNGELIDGNKLKKSLL